MEVVIKVSFQKLQKRLSQKRKWPERKKTGGEDEHVSMDETTEEEYKEAIKEIQAEHAKGKKGGKNHARINP